MKNVLRWILNKWRGITAHKNFVVKGENNQIILHDPKVGDSGQLLITIEGDNNTVELHEMRIMLPKARIEIMLCGNNLKVKIGKNFETCGNISFGITNYCPPQAVVENTEILIGDNVYFGMNSKIFVTASSHVKCVIGDDCMAADNVLILGADAHPVYDTVSGEIVNRAEDLLVGKHCFICSDVKILKNSTIPDGCIVSANALVRERFTEENCILAGDPAKVAARNRTWGRCDKLYTENRRLKQK